MVKMRMPSESLHVKSFAHLVQFLLVLVMLLLKQLVQRSLPDLVGRVEQSVAFARLSHPCSFSLPSCLPITGVLGSGQSCDIKLGSSMEAEHWRRSLPSVFSRGGKPYVQQIFAENTP